MGVKIHKRPTDEQCQSLEEEQSVNESGTSSVQQSNDINSQILAELHRLNGRIAMVKEKVSDNFERLSNVTPNVMNSSLVQHKLEREPVSIRSRHLSTADSSEQSHDLVVPSLNILLTSRQNQTEVDDRLRHLAQLAMDQGKLKSQRGVGQSV